LRVGKQAATYPYRVAAITKINEKCIHVRQYRK
jgi:hypothetical protein